MIRPGTFERVYAALKADIRTGRYRPGDRLEPALLSDALNASVTPVRDALHRLTGERLVEAPPHEGFRMPLLTEAGLRQLYSWHRTLVLLALRQGNNAAIDRDADPPLSVDLRELMTGWLGPGQNPDLAHALDTATDRLAALASHESDLLDGLEPERAAILFARMQGQVRELRSDLARYYRRRLRIVPALLERLYRAD